MPQLTCPIEGCTWRSQDLEADFSAALNTALKGHIQHVHSQNEAPAVTKPEKLNRPVITKGCTTEDWGYFTSMWDSYKTATKLSIADTKTQLLACCDSDLRRDLHRTDKVLEHKSEADILATIRSLSVRQENSMVSRLALHNMCQDREEGVRNFAARLRGQADVCKFVVKCSCDPATDVNYTNQMVRDVLIRGLNDQEIQQEILGHHDQDMELDAMIRLIEAKEAGRRSQASIMVEGAHGISQHKKAKSRQPSRTQLDVKAKCDKCNKTFTRPLGRNGTPRPYKLCKQCFTAQKPSPPDTPTTASSEEQAHIFDSICMASERTTKITGNRKCNAIKLHHHIFSSDKGWLQRRAKTQPIVTVTARVCKDDYTHFGVPLKSSPHGGPISAVADTGCQSCLIGLKLVYQLGFRKPDLINVQHKMNAVNKNAIEIMGAVLLRLSGFDKDGYPLETAQVCYVTPDTDSMYLSREACVDLGLISPSFPSLGEVSIDSSASMDIPPNDTDMENCTCPPHSLPPPVPEKLPFPTNEKNVGQLKQWILDYYAASTFNTCPHSRLPRMAGPPLALMVDPQATPVAVHTPIPVPLHWQDEVKAGLDMDVRLGVLEPVPVGEPVTWCHRMVVCRKKDGRPRRTVDLQALNAHCSRETHHTPSPFHQARSVPSGKKKSVLDAWNGYHSVPIRECDRHLTTFITPWGRYRYCTTPQGYISSGDGYTRRFDEIVAGFPRKTKCVDDTCLWGDTIEDCFYQVCQWLDLCGKNGIVLNPDKFVFAQDVVEFAGFDITLDDVKPSSKYIDAITKFPTPTNITDIRSWFGLVNQVSYYSSMTERMRPFRELLKPKSSFYWDDHLQKLFDETKRDIVDAIQKGVRIFDKGRKTCLTTDWSKDGLGFFLLQKHCTCAGDAPFCCHDGWKTTLVGSRFTHAAESRYAPIEGEALAVADALERTRYFVLGCDDLVVAVDHQPLLKILGDRKLEDIKNPRLLNLKEKTLPFKFKIIHVPGKKNLATDAVSRHPTGDPEHLSLPDDVHTTLSDDNATMGDVLNGVRTVTEECATMDINITIAAAHALDDLQAVTWDRVREATTSDPIMLELLETIEDGMPDSKMLLPPSLREYFSFREHLSTTDGVILYKDRIMVPPALRDEVLRALHSAHQGVSSMTARADTSVFWPGITIQIAHLRDRCTDCNRISPSQPAAPPTPLIDPTYPFESICADYFQYKGAQYLVIVDRYSNWPIVKRARDGAAGLIQSLREEFITYGIPTEISSDGGPEFIAAPTQTFLGNWGVKHRLSSVAFPHSNCRAEVGVKSCKRLLMNNTGPNGELCTEKFQMAMLQYRNTPDQDTKMSPAMIVFGHCIRDFIPVRPGRYAPHQAWVNNADLRELALRKRHTRAEELLSEHTRALPPLRVGDHVRIQNQTGNAPRKWDRTGLVVEVRQHDQYVIRVDGSGRVTLRNRRFLRKFHLYEASRHSPVATYPGLDSDHQPPTTKLPPSPAQASVPPPQAPVHSSPHTSTPPSSSQVPSPEGATVPSEFTPSTFNTSKTMDVDPCTSGHNDRRLDDFTPASSTPPAPPPLVGPVIPNAVASEPRTLRPRMTNKATTDLATPSPQHQLPTVQPVAPNAVAPDPRTLRPRRTIKAPDRYDPAVWDLSV
jgi:hypothetical protein